MPRAPRPRAPRPREQRPAPASGPPFPHGIDFRERPELYRVGRGEEGVLSVEPYKSELLPLWRFATPELARASSEALFQRFVDYKRAGDFVGMDMARKFLQMGWTRARRYANHRSGRKYAPGTREKLPLDEDPVKAESARVFRARYLEALSDPAYAALKAERERREREERAAARAAGAADAAGDSTGNHPRAPVTSGRPRRAKAAGAPRSSPARPRRGYAG